MPEVDLPLAFLICCAILHMTKYGIRRDKVKKYMGVFFSLSHILSFIWRPGPVDFEGD